MNNKLTFTGGEPNMTEDDFLRIQQSSRLGLHGMAKALSNDPYIVSGCVVTDNVTDIDITAGYIFFNGELIQVDAQNAIDDEGNGFYRYVISTTFEAGGDKTYLDSTPRQTWEKKRGVPTSVTVISGGDLDVIEGNRFDDLINAIEAVDNSPWTALTLINGWIGDVKIRLNKFGHVEIITDTLRVTVLTDTAFAVIPAEFRTNYDFSQVFFGSGSVIDAVRYDNSGAFELITTHPAGLDTANFYINVPKTYPV